MKTINKRLFKKGPLYVFFQPTNIRVGVAYACVKNGWCLDFYLPMLHVSWIKFKGVE